MHDQVHGDRFSEGNDFVESVLGVKEVENICGLWRDSFVIEVMMSKSTHHSTEAKKILPQIVA